MAKTGRPVTTLMLTDEERAELKARLAVRKAPAHETFRLRVVLGCAEGESGTPIAQRLKTSIQTVSKWRRRYEAYRFAGLSDAPEQVVRVAYRMTRYKRSWTRYARASRSTPHTGVCAA